MKGKRILIATPLLKWYMSHGMVVTDIHQVVEFTPKNCFKPFQQEVTNCRRIGDKDPAKSIIADTMKLIGNSAYGSLIMDKEKHQSVKYVNNERDACIAVNQPIFRKITELDDELYEIESVKKKVTLDLPIYLGYFILQYAKLRMLQFYYDCLDDIVDRSDFEYIEMDTDSAYIAITDKKLGQVVKKDKKKNYLNLIYNQCTETHDDDFLHQQWFPRDCCDKHRAHDKRTPGLFKLEAEGDEMIALSSKPYILKSATDEKIGCKGVNQNSLINPILLYRNVLQNQISISGSNKGFRSKNNTIFTYEQSRAGLTYFYCKREVLSDGVSTKPLDLVLSPFNIPDFEPFYDRAHPLSNDYPSKISVFGTCFNSVKEAYIFALKSENDVETENYIQESKIKLSMQWLEKRRQFMKELLIEKMRSNSQVRKKLKETQDLPLYNTIYDRYWGIGMPHKMATVVEHHRGSNVLGLLWEEIREIYYDEINKNTVEKCDLCLVKRSDVEWRKEREEKLCSNCSMGEEN